MVQVKFGVGDSKMPVQAGRGEDLEPALEPQVGLDRGERKAEFAFTEDFRKTQPLQKRLWDHSG